MDLVELVRSLLAGDLLAARQQVADAKRQHTDWQRLQRPQDLDDRGLVVAAGLVEMLAMRSGGTPPAWTHTIGPLRDALVLDPGLDEMPRSFAHAKNAGPEPLRRRNLIALPDFLDVA
ncbi:MAG: hypothetical protein JO051_10290 [Acidobacteriaceae bacterium]|nr:hypothetical protein [Acidobacteriaceae bacterium]